MSLSNNRLSAVIRASLESQPADGQARVERELVFYGKMVDVEQLGKADSFETQEQWEMRVEPGSKGRYGGCARVRKINGDKYILTTKTFLHGDDGCQEVEIEVSKDMFEQYKRLATSGMVKTRYFFKIDDQHTWEVDCYAKDDGTFEPWVKIDLELSGDIEVPNFPIELTNVVYGQPGKRTPEENKLLDLLMKGVFVKSNPYPKTGA